MSVQGQQSQQEGGGVEGFPNGTGRDPAAFMAARIPSFTQFLSSYDPSLLPLANLGPLAGSGAAMNAAGSRPVPLGKPSTPPPTC